MPIHGYTVITIIPVYQRNIDIIFSYSLVTHVHFRQFCLFKKFKFLRKAHRAAQAYNSTVSVYFFLQFAYCGFLISNTISPGKDPESRFSLQSQCHMRFQCQTAQSSFLIYFQDFISKLESIFAYRCCQRLPFLTDFRSRVLAKAPWIENGLGQVIIFTLSRIKSMRYKCFAYYFPLLFIPLHPIFHLNSERSYLSFPLGLYD